MLLTFQLQKLYLKLIFSFDVSGDVVKKKTNGRASLNRSFSADDISKYFSNFSQKTGFDISYKLSPIATACMKCQFLFSEKKKKKKKKERKKYHQFVACGIRLWSGTCNC